MSQLCKSLNPLNLKPRRRSLKGDSASVAIVIAVMMESPRSVLNEFWSLGFRAFWGLILGKCRAVLSKNFEKRVVLLSRRTFNRCASHCHSSSSRDERCRGVNLAELWTYITVLRIVPTGQSSRGACEKSRAEPGRLSKLAAPGLRST